MNYYDVFPKDLQKMIDFDGISIYFGVFSLLWLTLGNYIIIIS